MNHVVDRILAKITRAKQHIQDFQLALRAFYDSKPYTIGLKEDTQTNQRVYYITKADEIPDSLTAIAADIIQNLRSPLDHIAHQLVLDARGGTKPDWIVYYPISGSATHYPATRNGKIKGVRQEVIDAIDATEPYKGGKGHALWQLNELNKPDKHELLIGAGTFYAGVDIGPTLKARMLKGLQCSRSSVLSSMYDYVDSIPLSIVLRPADHLLPLKAGDELYGEPLDFEVHQNNRFTFEVSLNHPGVIVCEPAMKTFQDMANLINDIVVTLGRFLP